MAPSPRRRAARRAGTGGSTSHWLPSSGRMQLKLLCYLGQLIVRLEALPSQGSAGQQRR
uniref:Uncharacterized protein n=1 Tax=Arundo donax TaxID=35708 RepID=A0A0A9DE98_ARUDO